MYFCILDSQQADSGETKENEEDTGSGQSHSGVLTLLTTHSLRALFLPQLSVVASGSGCERVVSP